MQEYFSILEIASSGVKLLVGYSTAERFYVLHALESTSAKLIRGQITDKDEMSLCIKEVVNSASKSLKLPIKDVVLIFPSVSVTLDSMMGTTNSVSKEGIVSPFDVSNAFSIISKKVNVTDKALIDITPYSFIYDDGVKHRRYQDNMISNSFAVEADCSLIDRVIYDSFVEVTKNAGLNILRTILAPTAAISLISSYNVAQQFLLIDIGASMTTLSLGISGRLTKTVTLSYGSEDITKFLVERFKLDWAKADYYKRIYGLAEIPEFEMVFEDGLTVGAIKSAIEISLKPLIDFVKDYVPRFEIPEFYPIMLTGGGADLNNIDRFFSLHFQTRVIIYTPEFFGVRNKCYTNCVSALKYLELYPFQIQKRKSNDFSITRVDNKIVDVSKGEHEIL